MDVSQAIYARRSIRKFENKPVDKQTLVELCRLGAAGPSATNKRPWAFLIADEKESVDKLRSVLMFGKFNAPAAIVVCGDMRRTLPLVAKDYWIQDCSAAMENILLGAVEMGLGAVWCGVAPIQLSMKRVQKAMGMPPHIVPLGVAYIGFPDEQKEPRTQFEDEMVRWQRWERA